MDMLAGDARWGAFHWKKADFWAADILSRPETTYIDAEDFTWYFCDMGH